MTSSSIQLCARALALAIVLGSPVVKAGDSEPPPTGGPRADPTPAAQTKKKPLEWHWARFRTAEWVSTGVLGVAVIPAALIRPSSHPWTTTNAFDEAFRSSMRASSQSTRDAASAASDALLGAGIVYPVVADSLLGAYVSGKSLDVAFQMTAIDAEAFALTGFVTTLSATVVSRERPYGRLCPLSPALQSADCSGVTRYHSFFSGHASITFTSAALTCSHHAYLPLFGGGAGDVVACVTSMAAATTTGALRIVADRHYTGNRNRMRFPRKSRGEIG